MILIILNMQTLAMLLEEKSEMLNSHILHLVLSLVGTLDTRRDTSLIPNIQVFEDLLCDLDVWKNANYDLNRLLYEHFYELITELVLSSALPSVIHLYMVVFSSRSFHFLVF